MRKINLIGQRFGKLVVISEASKGKWGKLRVNCKCDCGEISIKNVGYLRSGETKSCGCNKFWIAYNQNGEKHWNWKGDEVGYVGLHQWLNTTYGNPLNCADCGLKGTKVNGKWDIHWALLKGKKYERNHKNFWGLCVKCHHKYDNLGFKVGNNRGKYLELIKVK